MTWFQEQIRHDDGCVSLLKPDTKLSQENEWPLGRLAREPSLKRSNCLVCDTEPLQFACGFWSRFWSKGWEGGAVAGGFAWSGWHARQDSNLRP